MEQKAQLERQLVATNKKLAVASQANQGLEKQILSLGEKYLLIVRQLKDELADTKSKLKQRIEDSHSEIKAEMVTKL